MPDMVDVPCRIIIGKFQSLKQGFGFIVHTENKNVIGEKSKF